MVYACWVTIYICTYLQMYTIYATYIVFISNTQNVSKNQRKCIENRSIDIVEPNKTEAQTKLYFARECGWQNCICTCKYICMGVRSFNWIAKSAKYAYIHTYFLRKLEKIHILCIYQYMNACIYVHMYVFPYENKIKRTSDTAIAC